MKTLKKFTAFAVSILAFAACNVPCCIDFNSSSTFPTGTDYTDHNDSLTTACGFEVRTDYLYLNGIPKYNFGKVGPAPIALGSGNVLHTNNITLRIFSILPPQSSTITFDYLDRGGYENLSVNGVLYSGDLSTCPATLGGATVSITTTPLTPSSKGKKGTVILTGNIGKFNIGGTEFYIDNICWQ